MHWLGKVTKIHHLLVNQKIRFLNFVVSFTRFSTVAVENWLAECKETSSCGMHSGYSAVGSTIR